MFFGGLEDFHGSFEKTGLKHKNLSGNDPFQALTEALE
jgi:hypothetical protein